MGSDNSKQRDNSEEEEDEFTQEYYRQRDETLKRRQEYWNQAEEELKHEIWSCKVGDLLELTAPLHLRDEEEKSGRLMQPEGQIYRVDELKGRCFYLERVSGDGVKVIGMFNVDIPQFFKIVETNSAAQKDSE